MYSQNDEERVILEAFNGEVGRFLDIGAFDGITFSNTRALVEGGWNGICVEPNPYSFLKLLQACEGYPVECVLAAVGPPCDAGLVPFYAKVDDSLDKHGMPAGAVSTYDEAHKAKWAMAVGGFTGFHVPVISPVQLVEHFGGRFDFVNIDVEGGNWRLLSQFPIKRVNPHLLCVEFDTHFAQIEEWLLDYCYEVIHQTTENLIARKT